MRDEPTYLANKMDKGLKDRIGIPSIPQGIGDTLVGPNLIIASNLRERFLLDKFHVLQSNFGAYLIQIISCRIIGRYRINIHDPDIRKPSPREMESRQGTHRPASTNDDNFRVCRREGSWLRSSNS